VRESLLEYLATAEQGLKHPRARRKARRLLGVVDRTAGFVLGLLSSKSLPPEELPEAHEAVVEALGEVGRPDSREYGYRRLLRMAGGGSFRRHLDASPLPAETCRALARLRRLESSAFGGKDAETRRERFMRHLDRVVVGLSKVKSAPPPEMDRSLASLYVQTGAVLRRSAEVLAALPTDAPDALAALAARAAEAATLAKDLDRIERADRILGGARRLLGESSRPLARAVVARLEGFAMDPSPGKADAREAFDEYLQEVRALEWLRLPDRPHLTLAMRLSGGAYRLAAQRFGEELRRGMAAVAQGSPVRLGWALTASPLFTLLRHRAVVETTGLGRLNPAALEPFSLPPKTWKVFLAALDKKVADGLRQCAQVRGWSSSLGASVKRWSRVFQTVAAAMARTRKAAEAGRDDLARVVGAIEQAADPQTPGDVWGEWATGFHTLEAAVALVAGYPTVASFHYDALSEVRDYHRLKNRLTVSTFDP